MVLSDMKRQCIQLISIVTGCDIACGHEKNKALVFEKSTFM